MVSLTSPQKKKKEDQVLLTYNGGVYNVTEFLADHPGGSDIIRQFAGQDISRIFDDPAEHQHSAFAHSLLKKYRVDDIHQGDEAGGDDNKRMREMKGKKFLDLDKPLISQMWNLKISREDYLREVHLPRHLGRPARFFQSDYLEIFTKTPWWFIPLFWGPILLTSGFIGGARLMNVDGWSRQAVALLWGFGLFAWTILEYTFHRFLFHMTNALPEHPIAFTVHFLFHGVHHFLPMDHYRLVMPPLMFSFFCACVLSLLSLVLPANQVMALFSGTLVGYIAYDMMHYFFHHGGNPPLQHIAMMKTYHMDHHYVNENLGFGVSTKIWDRVMDTELPPHTEIKAY